MKLRTSFFNGTVFRKDITRFAPVWILYSVGLLMVFMTCFSSYRAADTARNLGSTAYALAIVNFCYGMLNAQLLFGDLFQSRMTNALHALPVRREGWFFSHLAAGILFALVPNLGMALGMTVFSATMPPMPWLWLLTAMTTYLFFFGLAVFCAMCVGSRFAMVVVYGILNFGSLLAAWLYDEIYLPLLEGFTLDFEAFTKWSPVVWVTGHVPFQTNYYDTTYQEFRDFQFMPENLSYLGILAVLGVVLCAVALVLYRRRNLETAGDFIAVNWMKPVFLVLYTLAMGVVCQFFLGLFNNSQYVFLIIGVTVGWFTGIMLLERTAKIFKLKTFISFAVFVALLLGSLGLTAWDPLGVTRWVPEPEDVANVKLSYNSLEAEEGEDLALLVSFHQAILDNREESSARYGLLGVRITYTMKNGQTHIREYEIPVGGTAHTLLKPMLSRPEMVLGEMYEDWDSLWRQVRVTRGDYLENIYISQQSWQELKEAVEADCAAGTIIQHDAFHEGSCMYVLYFCPPQSDGRYREYTLRFYADAEHTMAWLQERNYFSNNGE